MNDSDRSMTGDSRTAERTESWNDRTLRLLGPESVERLARASVLVVGVGGVGGYAAEMLVRAGVGKLTLIDADCVAPSNLNRQLVSLRSNIGMPKTILYAERFHDINPEAVIDALQIYLSADQVEELLDNDFDYVLDCIDTVGPKVALLSQCMRRRVPVISSMGAGGRVDPTKVGYFDIWRTREDGLARAVRQQFRKLGVHGELLTVSSTEAPDRGSIIDVPAANKRTSYGTLSTIPSLFGLLMANHVIRKISGR